MVYIVMGVSGSGKTTIGKLLAEKLRLPFYDADDFHSTDNVLKMQSGTPLTDTDRKDWLQTMAASVVEWEKTGGAVLACSALKEKYRQALSADLPKGAEWIFLKGDKEVILERILNRKGHFMNTGLLDSQFQILEEPEYGLVVPIDGNAEETVNTITERLKLS